MRFLTVCISERIAACSLHMCGVFRGIIAFGNRLGWAGFWLTLWLFRALLIVVAGAFSGACGACFLRLFFFGSHGWWEVIRTGLIQGALYSGLWAGGISFIWLVLDRKQVLCALPLGKASGGVETGGLV
jgi:hypothetical protein